MIIPNIWKKIKPCSKPPSSHIPNPSYSSGWWLTYPSEKSWSSSVGKDDISYEMEHKSHAWNHQPIHIKWSNIFQIHGSFIVTSYIIILNPSYYQDSQIFPSSLESWDTSAPWHRHGATVKRHGSWRRWHPTSACWSRQSLPRGSLGRAVDALPVESSQKKDM